MLLGVAFKSPSGDVGQMEFRDVSINRDAYGSQMTVTDSCIHECDHVTYSYVILVQETATANIGLIDPDVETETGDN
jgi:hypothetical protein